MNELLVVEYLSAVIDWHRRGLVPLAQTLTGDPRCRFVNGNFFACATGSGAGVDDQQSARRFDAVLLDVDHSPQHLLSSDNAGFYGIAGLCAMQQFMTPGGVFAMWSNDPPDADFVARLDKAFFEVDVRIVDFPNPYTGGRATCTIYRARSASAV